MAQDARKGAKRMMLWERLADEYGTQPAAYMKGRLQTNPETNKVPCQECGKVCTKARGGAILTRSTVVCGKCYDPERHGEPSTETHYHQKATRADEEKDK
jgi:hypothetical protein